MHVFILPAGTIAAMALVGVSKDQDLSPQEALTYFDKSEVSCLPPVRPKGGEIYLLSARDDPSKMVSCTWMGGGGG